jgi:hypothetical protein
MYFIKKQRERHSFIKIPSGINSFEEVTLNYCWDAVVVVDGTTNKNEQRSLT